MPNLLIFAPCEKVIVDQNTNSVSLIGLLQEIHYKALPGQPPPPPGAPLPINWTIISLWSEGPSDAGIEYEQRIRIESEAGTQLMENITKWRFTQPNHRIITNVAGLPSVRRLDLSIAYRLSLTGEWTHAGAFPIVLMRDVL